MMNSDKTDVLLGGRLYMFNVGCSYSNDLLVRNGPFQIPFQKIINSFFSVFF